MANEKRLIDANALLELVQFRLPIDNRNAEVIAGCVDITRRLVENSPTVDAVEVVHGRWEDFADKHYKSAKRHDFRCSVCNNRASKFVGGIEDWWDMWEPNYCPNCGAKMDGDGNG